MALFMVLLIFIAGIGFLSQASTQYRSVNETVHSTQVLAIAEAGISDALLKLQRDWDFPPRSANDQVIYAYLETLEGTAGNRIGSFQVSIDRSLMLNAQNLLIIHSTGRLGPAEKPVSERTIRVEFDMNMDRASYFQIVAWNDLGGF